MLTLLELSKPLELEVDACGEEIKVILMQQDGPIAPQQILKLEAPTSNLRVTANPHDNDQMEALFGDSCLHN